MGLHYKPLGQWGSRITTKTGAFMNRHMLIGNIGTDLVLRRFPSGDAVVNFRMATSESWLDQSSGEWKEYTEWHNVVAKGRQAEMICEWGRKGSHLMIEGRSRTRKWVDDKNTTHHIVEVHADWWKPSMYPQSAATGEGRQSNRHDDDAGGYHGGEQEAPRDYAKGPFSPVKN